MAVNFCTFIEKIAESLDTYNTGCGKQRTESAAGDVCTGGVSRGLGENAHALKTGTILLGHS
jgi:hypothetical protein